MSCELSVGGAKVEPLAKNSDSVLTNVGGLPLFPEADLESLPEKDIIEQCDSS